MVADTVKTIKVCLLEKIRQLFLLHDTLLSNEKYIKIHF